MNFCSMPFRQLMLIVSMGVMLCLSGCNGKKATVQHQDQVEDVFGQTYLVPNFPKDKPCIGHWLSPKGKLVEAQGIADMETRTERSHSNMQQDFAFSFGTGAIAKTFFGPAGEAGIDIADVDRSQFKGLEIITPEVYSDIPFEPNVAYVTEAMRLTRYDIASKGQFKAEAGAKSANEVGIGTLSVSGGTDSNSGTSGDGLVVAYKLEMLESMTKQESGFIPLPLNKNVSFDAGGLIAKATMAGVQGGSGNALPYDIWWACDNAESSSENMVAAWVFTVRSLGQRDVDIKVGFPAIPAMSGCAKFSRVVDSYQKPGTDTFVRTHMTVTLLEAEVDDFMQPKVFDARISFSKEEFTTRIVKPQEIAQAK